MDVLSIFFLLVSKLEWLTLNIFCSFQWRLLNKTSDNFCVSDKNDCSIIRSKIEEIVSLPPNARRDCKTFLRYIKLDINQVTIDGNNLIPKYIRDLCYEKFKNIPDFDLPEIVGVVIHTKIYINKENSNNHYLLL